MADDHYSKRKYEDHSPPPRRTGFSSGPPTASPPSGGAPAPASYNSVPPPPTDEIQLAKQRAQAIAARIFNAAEAKRPRVDSGDDDDSGVGVGSLGSSGRSGGGTGLGFSSSAGGGHGAAIPSLSSHGSTPQYSSYGGYQGTSKKIEIPNGRVGVIIGKSGETIKNLQLQSGAKIQVTRDLDAEPGSQTRPVELSGTPDQISRAEHLINEVLAEADVASSGNISGRKYSAPQPGAEQFQMKIGNNKVGLVIGKGGETIKSMQAKSGARIQVIPLHLPPGDPATERTVYIDGTAEQIEIAKQLVNEVTSENRARNPMSGGYSQQGYRPPRPQSNWGSQGAPPMQQPGYGYTQPGAYPGAPPQYGAPQQPYGSYPPTSGGYQTGWDQSSNQQSQQAPPGTGYDYYNQQQQPQQQQSAPGSAAPADATSYNSSQPPAYASQGYGDSTYSQQSGGQQAYGHDYSNYYQTQGQQQGYSQQTGYDQQGYVSSGYGSAPNSTQDGSAPSYGAQGGASQASPGPQTSTPAAGSHPGYSSQPPTSATSSYPAQGSAPQSGYGALPPPQSSYGTQPPAQGGYGQGAYGQPPQGQKPPNSSPYGQALPPGSAPGGYGQYGYSHSQQGYGAPPPYPGAPSAGNPGYGSQQYYGDPYGSGSYGQPATYSTEATTGASQDQSASTPATAAATATAAAPAPASNSSGASPPTIVLTLVGCLRVRFLQGGDEQTRYCTDHLELFRQESYFAYLFGVQEPGFYGAIDIVSGQSILFAPRLPADYAVWMGEIKPSSYFKDRYKVDMVFYVDEIAQVLQDRFGVHGKPLLLVLYGKNTDSGNYSKPASFEGMEKFDSDSSTLHPILTECRVIKSDMELALIQYANDVSSEAHIEVMRQARPGMKEYQLESIFLHHVYMYGGCRHCSYTCICATGENSSVLHYGHAAAPNDRTLNDGDMALMDMGAEYHFYGSDITCSYPINGKFSNNQTIIYNVSTDKNPVSFFLVYGPVWMSFLSQ
ncbi:hypothetical protein ABZP36_022226 [Zizania latifolia]